MAEELVCGMGRYLAILIINVVVLKKNYLFNLNSDLSIIVVNFFYGTGDIGATSICSYFEKIFF